MTDLNSLGTAIATGSVEVIDLTSPLHSGTPVLALPADFGQTAIFQLEEISRYDDRGPAWYWNNIHTGEHTGTHLDAPIHWVTGQDKDDVSQVPPQRLIGPAVVIDKTAEVAANPDYWLTLRPGRPRTATSLRIHGCFFAPVGQSSVMIPLRLPTQTKMDHIPRG